MKQIENEPHKDSNQKDETSCKDTHQLLDFLSEDEELFISALQNLSQLTVSHDEAQVRLKKASDFVDYAEIDFKSAKLLFNVGLFSTSMYHLQQSIEKIVKAYMVYVFNLSNKEIERYVSHESPKAFFKLLQKFKSVIDFNVNYLEKNRMSHPFFRQSSYSDIIKLENELKNNKESIAKMDATAIDKFLDIADKLTGILSSQNNESTKMLMLRVISELKKELKDSEIMIQELEKAEYETKESDNLIFPGHYTYLPALYLLALLTYPHATIPRYPKQSFHISEYNENLGIVKCFNRISQLVDRIILSYNAALIEQ